MSNSSSTRMTISTPSTPMSHVQRVTLDRKQLVDSLLRHREHFVHLLTREWFALSGSLDLDKFTGTSANYVHIDLGIRVFGIGEIEDRRGFDDSDTNGGNFTQQRRNFHDRILDELPACKGECDVCSGDGRAPGTTISLDHIAVDKDLALTEKFCIDDCSQAATDQPLNFLCASRRSLGLALGSGVGRPRQHGVFGGDPSESLVS